jgi:hypothetical protein
MSTTLAVESPDAVAKSESSLEKFISMMALLCTLKETYGSSNAGSSSCLVSRSRTPPCSSPIAVKEFARKS